MLSPSAFSSADNSYLDLDYSGCHKNLIHYNNIIVYYFIQSEMSYSKKQQGGRHGEGLWRQVNDLLKFVIFEAVSLH